MLCLNRNSMEKQHFEPVNRGPRHLRVELDDLVGKSPAAVVAENDIAPASQEFIDYLWQREAAISALNGIKMAIERETPTFAEKAREKIQNRTKRLFGKVASIGSGIVSWGREAADALGLTGQDYDAGSLADLGFAGADYSERHIGRARPAWSYLNEQPQYVPDTPAAAARTFSVEELADIRRIVQQTREQQGIHSALYESHNA